MHTFRSYPGPPTILALTRSHHYTHRRISLPSQSERLQRTLSALHGASTHTVMHLRLNIGPPPPALDSAPLRPARLAACGISPKLPNRHTQSPAATALRSHPKLSDRSSSDPGLPIPRSPMRVCQTRCTATQLNAPPAQKPPSASIQSQSNRVHDHSHTQGSTNPKKDPACNDAPSIARNRVVH